MKTRNTLFTLLITVLLSGHLFAQEKPLSVITKVTMDEVRLKWLPVNYEQMRILVKEGCTVEQVELLGSTTAQTADYTSGLKTIIAPTSVRLASMNVSDSAVQRMLALIDPFTAAAPAAEKENRDFAFALAVLEITVSDALSNAVGCQLTVQTKKGKRYGFRISMKGLPTAFIEVNTDEPTKYPTIADFEAKIDRKKTVELTWTAKKYQSYGYAFWLEKSVDAPKSGTYLTQTPYFPVRTQDEKTDKQDFLRDEALTEGKNHFYRLVGLNYFGEQAYFSEWKKIYVPRHLNAEVFIDTVYADKQTRVVKGSAFRLSKEPINLKEYVLLRSDKKDGTYSFVQQKNSTDTVFQFTVDMLKTGDQFYYKVAAVSTDNDSVYSMAHYLFTLDQEPPSAPSKLSGTINEQGIVSLTWSAPADNDLEGYRIFRANHKKEDFAERNTVLSLQTTFTDTLALNNLTPEVYYCVKSVDKNFNNSPFSDTILVLKPDTIAPVPTLLRKPLVHDSLIRLSWINSPSADVAQNVLLRVSNNQADTLVKWSDTLSVFTDQNIIPGTSYNYLVLTNDKSGNKSTGTPQQLYYEPGYRKSLVGFKTESLPKEKLIRLSWQIPDGEVFSYQIYKATETGKLTLLKTIENGATTQFEDRNISSGKTYRYTVKYILKSGIHGLPTNEMVVLF
ncbi:MAG: hypothetical protein QE487_07965 [Fluviicola sp.]|nr:hypothetical protein [Fluviicola sp.]